jgi:hypothetical protein
MQKRISIEFVIGVLACAVTLAAAQSVPSTASDPAVGPAIHVEDVDRFYRIYDAAGGHPTADQLQRDYLDQGSDGLRQFARIRNISGARIAEALVNHPEIYQGAKRCLVVVPRARERLDAALRTLARQYPQGRFRR